MPGCRSHTACGCIPSYCSCSDFDCIYGRKPAPANAVMPPLVGLNSEGDTCKCPAGTKMPQATEGENGSGDAVAPVAAETGMWCAMQYFSPLGYSAMRTFPTNTIKDVRPQSAALVPTLSFETNKDFSDVVGMKNYAHLATVFTGTLSISKEGSYEVCIESSDGSHLLIDEKEVVARPGVHAKQKLCKAIQLAEGDHDTRVMFFTNGARAYLKVTYSGPDTDDRMVEMPSFGPDKPCSIPPPRCACGEGWCTEWYFSPTGSSWMTDMPDLSKLSPQLVRVERTVDFSNHLELAAATGLTSFVRVAAHFQGVLSIFDAGQYEVCVEAIKNGGVWVDGEHLVKDSNNGRPKCGTILLQRGDHDVVAQYFHNNEGAEMKILYSGPDTDFKSITMPSPWHSPDQCGANPKAPSETCDCTADEEPAGLCSDFKSIGYEICSDKPGCGMDDKCGCKPIGCECGDDECIKKAAQAVSVSEIPVPETSDSDTPSTLSGETASGKECTCPAPIEIPRAGGGPTGFCTSWYLNPLGTAGIAKFPENIKDMIPQKSVVTHNVDLLKDSDFTAVAGLDHFNKVALTWRGILAIKEAGHYTFCVTSGDGSHLYVGGVEVSGEEKKGMTEVAAMPGIHNPQTNCGHPVKLLAGEHEVYGTFFENGGTAFLKTTYSGPDTKYSEVSIPSSGFVGECTPDVPKCKCGQSWCSKWYFNPVGDSSILRFPDVSKLTPQAVEDVKTVMFQNHREMSQAVERPGSGGLLRVAAEFTGTLSVHDSGIYEVCTTSASGSHMWIDGEHVIKDNGGVHGSQKKCNSLMLSQGDHPVRVAYFQNTGHAQLKLTYSGADTDYKEVAMPSSWNSPEQCGANPNAPPEVCDCTPQPAGACADFKSIGYEICSDKPGCGMDDKCGCKPIGCECGDDECIKKAAQGEFGVEVAMSDADGEAKARLKGITPSGKACTCPVPAVIEKYGDEAGYCTRWYYSPLGNAGISKFPDVSKLLPQKDIVLPHLELLRDQDFEYITGLRQFDRVALTWKGILAIQTTGEYTFCVTSSDGAHMYVDDAEADDVLVEKKGLVEVAAIPGIHGPRTACGHPVRLEKGDHEITGTFFENGGAAFLKATYSGPDTKFSEELVPSTGFKGACSLPDPVCRPGKGYCSKWFFDPLGSTGVITNFRAIKGLNPQVVKSTM